MKILKGIIILVLSYLTPYILIAFITLELNVLLWSPLARFGLVFFGSCTFVLSLMYAGVLE